MAKKYRRKSSRGGTTIGSNMKIIYGAISILIGLIMLPIVAQFTETDAILGGSGANDTAIENATGLLNVLDLILYGFTFGLVGIGVGLIYLGFKKK